MKEIICTVCPKGCRIKVSKENELSGYSCDRGIEYANNELHNPMRMLTSTVVLRNGLYDRCPVKTSAPIPKNKMFEVMEQLKFVVINAPINVSDVIIKQVAGTNSDIVATRSFGEIDKKELSN